MRASDFLPEAASRNERFDAPRSPAFQDDEGLPVGLRKTEPSLNRLRDQPGEAAKGGVPSPPGAGPLSTLAI